MHAVVLLLLALLQPAPAAMPKTEISNGRIRASIYLPDAEKGYYRGTRFDWAGQVASATWKGHEYFGQWFEKYDPKLHDAIMGPVEEFLTGDSALGYADAKPGETFVRIGVGVVRKLNDGPYRRFDTYEIVDPGKRTLNKSSSSVEFIHELQHPSSGYSYVYTKRLRLSGDSIVLEGRLKNTGSKPISTSVYNHNFFTLDNQQTGPDFIVRFPFDARAARDLGGLAEVKGRELTFLKSFESGQTIFSEIEGFGTRPADYDFRVENRKTGAGVRITGDRPLLKLPVWSAWKTVCPEPYIDVSAAAGQESSWRITYEFYEVSRK
jgi:hypothetical protein